MKVLIVHSILKPYQPIVTNFHEGVATLSALLKEQEHHVTFVQPTAFDAAAWAATVRAAQPDAVIVFVESRLFARAAHFARGAAREAPAAQVLLVGPHAGAAVDECLAVEGVTGVFAGEFETATAQFLDALAAGGNAFKTPNFCFRLDGRVYRNQTAPPADPARLPVPDRTLYPFQELIDAHPTLGAEFCAHRGGAYDQAFFPRHAQTPTFREFGPLVQSKPVDALLDEIAGVLRHYDRVPLIGFQDESFPHDEAWTAEFAAKYRARIGRPFWCHARPDHLTERAAALLAEAGCVRVRLALEAGNSYLRSVVLGRFLPRFQIVNAFQYAARAGMQAVACTLLGVPYENEEMIVQTIKLHRLVKPHWCLVRLFEPLPGTALHTLCVKKGWLRRGEGAAGSTGPGAPREPWEPILPVPPGRDYDRLLRLHTPWIRRDNLIYFYEHFIELVYAPTLRLPWEMEREEEEYVLYE